MSTELIYVSVPVRRSRVGKAKDIHRYNKLCSSLVMRGVSLICPQIHNAIIASYQGCLMSNGLAFSQAVKHIMQASAVVLLIDCGDEMERLLARSLKKDMITIDGCFDPSRVAVELRGCYGIEDDVSRYGNPDPCGVDA